MLDWKKWKESKMPLMDFLLLTLIYWESNQKTPVKIKEHLKDDDIYTYFLRLIARGYIREGVEKYYLTAKGLEVFNSGQDNFKDFYELFPQKVPNNTGGERILRAVSMDSMSGRDAYRRWKMITGGNEEKERHIIACLAAEITQRTRQGDLAYMNNISTWLNKRKWEMYEHLIELPQKDPVNKEKSI